MARDGRMGWILLAAVPCLACGCGPRAADAGEPEAAALGKVGALYLLYAQGHQGKGPPSEAEFRRFVGGLTAQERRGVGLEEAADFLRSPRDGQPFAVAYGLDTRTALASGLPQGPPNPGQPRPQIRPVLIVWEGQGGQRLAFDLRSGAVRTVPEAELPDRTSSR
jgi:hypothetical protein